MKRSIDEALERVDPSLRKILMRIPTYQPDKRLPPDWYYWQIIERYSILKHSGLVSGLNVLEVGCGPQAMATIPLALLVGEKGRVVALDRKRWGLARSGKMGSDFWELMEASGLGNRVIPLQEDARRLPFPFSCFDLAVCIHGIRSFESREAVVKSIEEMLRVSKERIFLAESSPIARNMAQKAHQTMYNLRRPTFIALGAAAVGDLPYYSPEELEKIAEEAGAWKISEEEFLQMCAGMSIPFDDVETFTTTDSLTLIYTANCENLKTKLFRIKNGGSNALYYNINVSIEGTHSQVIEGGTLNSDSIKHFDYSSIPCAYIQFLIQSQDAGQQTWGRISVSFC